MKKLEPTSIQLRRALICQSSCQEFCNKLTLIDISFDFDLPGLTVGFNILLKFFDGGKD